MWRSPLRVALVLLLGLTVILLNLWSYPTQAVTAEPLEPTNTPGPVSVRTLNVRVTTLGGCPGSWTVLNLQSPEAGPISLVILDTTRFTSAQCADIRVNDTLVVRGEVALDRPNVVLARFVQRIAAAATPTSITFRGTVIGNPRQVSNAYEVQFNTEVSGALTVTVPINLLAGVVPQRGDKADVTALRQGNTWLATSIKFLSATSDIGFSGLIEVVASNPGYVGDWKIASNWVKVTGNTIIDGIPRLYRRATVVAEWQGNELRAKSITIDPTDAPATAFELTGTASITDQDPYGNSSRLGCLTFTLDPATPLPPGISRWNDLTGKTVRVSGSRVLGPNLPFKADSVTVFDTPYTNPLEVEVMGYVDVRQAGGTATEVQLQIGGVVIRVPLSTPNLDEAVQGTVVRVHGACISQGVDDSLLATSVAVVSKPYVAFSGAIEVIEMAGNDITGFQIRPRGSNDRQHIRRLPSVPFVGSNDPAVGACLNGYGYYQRDGSIEAQRLEVVACPPTTQGEPEGGS